MNIKSTAIVLILTIVLGGCAALNKEERAQYNEWKESGELVVIKKPIAALYLGILPGVGSFYVGKPARGVLDILLWYPSVLWDGPISMAEASRMNYEATQQKLNEQSEEVTGYDK
jgi:hypothetical protein